MRRLHSTITLLIVLAVVSALDARGTAPGGTPSAARTADIVRASGEAERVTVVGVGCTEAICSRMGTSTAVRRRNGSRSAQSICSPRHRAMS